MSHETKDWENRALDLLGKSLRGIPNELNELDWKSDISENTEKLAKHISAFSNTSGGGFLVFGITNDGGFTNELTKQKVDEIVRKIGNIGHNNLSNSVTIDHAILNFENHNLLFIYVLENEYKPISLRGNNIYDSYKRSVGQTVIMSRDEVRSLLAYSNNITFEEQIALNDVEAFDIISKLKHDDYYTLLSKKSPTTLESIIHDFIGEGFIVKEANDNFKITNLGAILFAKDISSYKTIRRKTIRVIIYRDESKIDAIKEQQGVRGYASGFQGLINYIMEQFRTNEVINTALRTEVKMYPEVAVREFVANALVHQDFATTGTGVMIEIFSNRIEITNPGTPLIDTNRFIGANPKSRNETMASMMRRLGICEERGSGIIRALSAIEVFQLPAPKFIKGEDYTKVIMYAQKEWQNMDKEDKIRVCYQHTCLEYITGKKTSNVSIRTRFGVEWKTHTVVSRIIADTIEAKLIKSSNPDSKSRKHATYVPYWA